MPITCESSKQNTITTPLYSHGVFKNYGYTSL